MPYARVQFGNVPRVMLTVAILSILLAWSGVARAAGGYWRFTGYDTTPPQSRLDENDRAQHAINRVAESKVTGAFQPAGSAAGTLEQSFKNDDVDHVVYLTTLKFSFTTGIDMRALSPQQKIHFNGVLTVGGNDKSRSFRSTGTGKMAADAGEYFLSTGATVGQEASGEGVFEVPNGGPGSTMTIYAAGYISAMGALGGNLNLRYEWVAGAAPALPSPPQRGAAASGDGNFAGQWRTSEGDMTLTQSGPAVSGTYTQDNGRIYAALQGGHLVGFWGEDSSAQSCPTQRLNTSYWGRIDWVLSADGRHFQGRWSYCDAEPSGSWTGDR